MKRIFLTAALLVATLLGWAQKKPLDHSVYDGWKRMGGILMTEDAKFSIFTVSPQEGDTYMVSLNLSNFSKDSIARVSSPEIINNGKHIAFTIKPKFNEVREGKIKKLKPDQMPKDTLGIYNLFTKELQKIPYIKSFRTGNYNNEFLAYKLSPPADTSKNKKPVKKEKDEGEDLMLCNLSTGKTDTIKFVADYAFSRGGDTLFFTRRPNSKDSVLETGLFLLNLKSNSLKTIYKHHLKQSVRLPITSEDNKHLVFYAKLDTTKNKDKYISILHYDSSGSGEARVVADNNITGLPEGMRISENSVLQLNKNADRLFFGISKILPERDTTLIDFELARLDIWHYKDDYIQPYQLLNFQKNQRKTSLCTMSLNEEPELIRLAQEEYESVNVPDKWSSDWGYAFSNYEYRLESQWDANPRTDLYLIDVRTGKSTLLFKDRYITSPTLSENTNYMLWFDNTDNNWYSYHTKTGKTICLTKGLEVSFSDELHDTPNMARPYGTGSWLKDDKSIFIYDRYDVWVMDPEGITPPYMLTDGLGREKGITFRISNPKNSYIPQKAPNIKRERITLKETIYFAAFNNITKESGYYYKEMGKRRPQMKEWIMEPVTFTNLIRSKDASTITYVKHNFTNSPNLWITRDNFKTQTKLTEINSQQSEYNWGTAELIKWKSRTGRDVEGILYKPEDFDPTKKYPMLVYFYERVSDDLYAYKSPAPSRSTINIPYFVSNGYLVFTPDIYYEIGHPGKSAIDCIVPGVEKVCENPWADRDNVGIQGQSWGGYQVAYMITQPEAFKWKAAEAGALVANMTSAYGGIRWGSGMVRQFQYEHTQSRIGKTLWNGFDLYIENSPLFFADKIETPLLIMHNDEDDAVPWYQGIEYFNALRRLGKPVWMLQYNREKHNIQSRYNAMDLSIRLGQFFDHYLKGAPMPPWMEHGVPASLKGIDWGL